MKVQLKKLSALFLAFTMLFNITIVSGEENEEVEKNESEFEIVEPETITQMDENGNVSDATDSSEYGPIDNDISTFGITQQKGVVNFRTKSASEYTTYTEVGTGNDGYTNGHYGADAAYIEHSSDGTLVKFMQAGVVGWVKTSDVEVLDYSSSAVKSLSYYAVSNGRIIHYISTNIASSTYPSSLDVGPASAAPYLQEGKDYFSYDGHYFYDGTDTTGAGYLRMLTDYRNGVRTNSVNSSNPYYNYFQFLPHRSESTYSASTIDSYLNGRVTSTSKMRNTGSAFVENQNKYGTNALLMIGVAANESAWGTSSIAQNKNNLFGHAAYDSDPSGSSSSYSSVSYSIYYHAYKFLSYGFLDPVTDSRYYGSHLGDKASGVNVKYASDPYWGEKAASVAWAIDRANGSKDAFKYTIGIKDVSNTSHTYSTVRKEASASSTQLYTTAPYVTNASSKSPSNYPFIVLGDNTNAINGYYKIQSDGPLNADRSAVSIASEYNWSRDYAYMPTTNTKIVSIGNNSNSSGSKPVINNVVVSNVDDTGYTVTAHVQNATIVRFPTWTNANGQDDIQWYESSVSNGVATIRVLTTNHNNETGTYSTHIYAYGEYDLMASSSITQNVPSKSSELKVSYQVHVQEDGWQNSVSNGQTAGTLGQSKRLEAIKVNIENSPYSGSIKYQTHVEDIGWQTAVSDGALSGTSGQSKRLEAIKISLTGLMATHYDVYYRVHVEDYGWLGWAKNGEAAGSSQSKRLEGIEIVLVEKGKTGPSSTIVPYMEGLVSYQTHIQDVGWQDSVRNGVTSGTSGQSKRLEAIKITSNGSAQELQYRTHIQDIGWEKTYKTAGNISGTNGQSKRLEAIQIKLSGSMATKYDIYYRTYVEDYGWLGWAENGASSGTESLSKRMEAIQIVLVPKGCPAPGSEQNSYITK
ncbi:MAG: glucosaminidase domain-containing protein [Coprobacillaceae bacterium]